MDKLQMKLFGDKQTMHCQIVHDAGLHTATNGLVFFCDGTWSTQSAVASLGVPRDAK